jgi:putative nucleotidyltransferase with HDIG domain
MTTISIVAQSEDRLADLRAAISGDIAADYLRVEDLPHCRPQDTVIIDVDLERYDDLQTVRAWLSQRSRSGTVILCVDNAASHHRITQARALGATAAVQRPLTAPQFRDIVLRRDPQILLTPSRNSADASSDLAAIEDIFSVARSGQVPSMASVSHAGAQIVERIQEIGLSRYLSTIRSHHSRTYAHCLIVTAVAASFGIHLGFGRKDQERVAIAGLLHDIGKSQIALDILEKPADLSEQERAIMNAHPVIGYDLLRGTPGLADDTLDMVLHHHECLDGSGYPHGLRGSQISDLNRVITISDVYGALIEPRPYKPPMTLTQAYDVLQAMGPKLDRALVRAFSPLVYRLACAA